MNKKKKGDKMEFYLLRMRLGIESRPWTGPLTILFIYFFFSCRIWCHDFVYRFIYPMSKLIFL